MTIPTTDATPARTPLDRAGAPALERTIVTADGPAWLANALVLAAYALLILVTRTLDQGDTSVYGDDLMDWIRGRPTTMWEFGHAIWRPLAYLAYRVTHPTIPASDGVLFDDLVQVMTWLSLVGGAVAVVAMRSWLQRLGASPVAAVGATITFAAASAFLGYAQTGSSYIPGVAMLLIALRELAADEGQSDTRTLVVAGLAFALAVLLWVPLVLAVPGCALSALILRGDSPRRRRVAIGVCLLSGAITIAAYVPVALLAGVRSVPDFRAWMTEATHGIQGIGGLQRAIVGFGRSLLNMDRLGLVAKRYLSQDPYNPATVVDVARAGLFRLGALYLVLAAMTIALAMRAYGRRALVFLIAVAIPVVGFALKWQGGDLERYLGLFPALFACIALLVTRLDRRAQIASVAALVLVTAFVNVPAISRSKSREQCATLSARIASVPRNGAGPTVLITPHELDEISTFRNRCSSAALLRESSPPRVFGLVMANHLAAPRWRLSLSERAEKVWSEGGHLWISRRAFVPAPPESWKWAEGDDPRLHWKDFPEFFAQVDVGPPVGGADGFVELLPTPRTRDAMARAKQELGE